MLTLFKKKTEEERLIEACRAQDRSAQFKVYEKYSAAMLQVAFRITKDEDEAQDVLQESFVRAFSRIEQFEGQSTFGAWLKRIVVNQSINLVNKRKDLDYVETLPEPEPDQDLVERYLDHINDDQIAQSIYALPEGYRVVLTLYLLEGYDHEEIAQILGISVGSSKSQFSRAKAKLRTALKENYGA